VENENEFFKKLEILEIVSFWWLDI